MVASRSQAVYSYRSSSRTGVRNLMRNGHLKGSIRALAAAAFLLPGCPAESSPAPDSDAETRALDGRVVGVTDGDTLTLLVDREQIRIRLAQIDAPELKQPYGRRAKTALSALAFGKQARVEVVDIDRYGRTVGEIFVDRIDVNHAMVREGHAWAYTRYSHSTEIIELEDSARAAKKGLWALPEDQREPPWIWRHPPREARAARVRNANLLQRNGYLQGSAILLRAVRRPLTRWRQRRCSV